MPFHPPLAGSFALRDPSIQPVFVTDVLMRIQTHPASQIDDLLPDRTGWNGRIQKNGC